MIRQMCAAVSLVLASVAPALAQVGVRVHVSYDSSRLDPSRSLEVVTGESTATGMTVGGSVLRIWRGVFADVAGGRRSLEGQRVFRHGGQTFTLGIPVTIEWRTVDAVAGWRIEAGRVTPYAGVGMTTISYRESAAFAHTGDDVSGSARGLLLLAGAEVAVTRWLGVGAEVRRRSAEGILGEGGVSQEFGERSIGGTTLAVRVSVGR
jgi:opacity protein-like surface antigen